METMCIDCHVLSVLIAWHSKDMHGQFSGKPLNCPLLCIAPKVFKRASFELWENLSQW